MDWLSHGGIVAARILISVVFVVPVIMPAGRVLELAAGFRLALGVFPRLMALALLAFLVPATFMYIRSGLLRVCRPSKGN
jgi:uncharacterized membrane protein YphA (DoxX/SURF4 family)